MIFYEKEYIWWKKYFKFNKLELYFRFENFCNNKYFILKYFKNFLLCCDKMLVVWYLIYIIWNVLIIFVYDKVLRNVLLRKSVWVLFF